MYEKRSAVAVVKHKVYQKRIRSTSSTPRMRRKKSCLAQQKSKVELDRGKKRREKQDCVVRALPWLQIELS